MALVKEFQEITGCYFICRRNPGRRLEVRYRDVGIESSSLKRGRQECGIPMIRTGLGHAAWIRDGDEGGQILILCTQRIADPGAGARETIEREARAHLVFG